MHPQVARTRSQVAVAHRRGNPDEIASARRDLAAAKLEDYIKRVVDNAPPLSEAQKASLASLIRGGAAA